MTGSGRICGVLLAAGAGRRAGGPKALRIDADGSSWLRRSARVLLEGGCEEVVAVLGAGAGPARSLLAGVPRTRIAVASDWAAGPGATLRTGLAASKAAAVVVVHLVDLPDVGAEVVQRLLQVAGQGPTVLARASYQGRPGHPVLLGSEHVAPLLAQLVRDSGARAYLDAHRAYCVECADLATGLDRDD